MKLALRKGNAERIAFIPDLHAADHNPKAVNLAAQITEAFKPDRIIWLGDCLDAWWATSRFPRDPEKLIGAAQKEYEIWDKIRPMFRAKRVQIVPGNHDARVIELRDTILHKHPELINSDLIKSLNLKDILCPSGEEYIEEGYVTLAEGEFTATHGIYTGTTSSKRELLRWGTSGVCGHDHTLGRYYQPDSRGIRVWCHAGYLGNNPPKYRRLNDPAPQLWMHGMAVCYTEGNQFDILDIPFTRGFKAMLGGQRYKA